MDAVLAVPAAPAVAEETHSKQRTVFLEALCNEEHISCLLWETGRFTSRIESVGRDNDPASGTASRTWPCMQMSAFTSLCSLVQLTTGRPLSSFHFSSLLLPVFAAVQFLPCHPSTIGYSKVPKSRCQSAKDTSLSSHPLVFGHFLALRPYSCPPPLSASSPSLPYSLPL